MYKYFYTLILIALTGTAIAQEATTYQFAEKDGQNLYLDVYQPFAAPKYNQCIVYVFGGGFISGARDSEGDVAFMQQLAREGYTAISIDYRLGLKGVTKVGITATKPLERAIDMAVEDLFSAIEFILANAEELNVDTKDIVLIGSSAGAITVLQADYELNNGFSLASKLPTDFHFGGVIPFSGAIFSKEGKVQYREHAPAPTFFLHGTEDRLVPYKQIKLFNMGMFGTNSLIKQFEKFDLPYFGCRFEGLGHEVAGLMTGTIEEINWFITNYVDDKNNLQIDQTYYDPELTRSGWGSYKPKDLYGNQ